MEDHTHGEDGRVIVDAPAPENAEVEAVTEVVSGDVAIAEINAARDVQLAKLAVKASEAEEVTELAALQGEVRALREIVDRLAPAPEPDPEPVAPIVVDPAPAAPAEPVVAEPPEAEHKPPAKKANGLSWF